MKIANSPDIFQQKKKDLFHGFEFICVYIDDILVLTKGDFKYINEKIKPKPYPMPKINKLLLKLECSQYAE